MFVVTVYWLLVAQTSDELNRKVTGGTMQYIQMHHAKATPQRQRVGDVAFSFTDLI